MTREVKVAFTTVGGTQAGLAQAGGHSLIADRPLGRAGGGGLGFNGAELLAAALGGCFWNDLHYVADAKGTAVTVHAVEVGLTLEGSPLRATGARIVAQIDAATPQIAKLIFDAACADSTIANSIQSAVPVTIVLQELMP